MIEIIIEKFRFIVILRAQKIDFFKIYKMDQFLNESGLQITVILFSIPIILKHLIVL